MLICEDVFLLLTRDDGKVEGWGTQRGYGLVGAVITDLVLHGRVDLSADKDPRVTVVDPRPLGPPALDSALARLGEKNGKKFSSLISDRKLNPEEQIADDLAARGIIGVEEKKMLGMVPARYPVLDPRPEQETRERLRGVIHGLEPTAADTSILSILQGLDAALTVLRREAEPLGKRDLKKRIGELAVPGSAGQAVKRAVDSLNAIIVTAAIMPAITSSSN